MYALVAFDACLTQSADNPVAQIDVTTSTAAIYGYEVLLALGSGAFIQAGYTVIYLFIKPEDGAYGVSFMSLGSLPALNKSLLILLKTIL